MSCSGCVHYLDRGAADATAAHKAQAVTATVGACRRFPPRWTGEMSVFPSVHCDQGCGEFYSKVPLV